MLIFSDEFVISALSFGCLKPHRPFLDHTQRPAREKKMRRMMLYGREQADLKDQKV